MPETQKAIWIKGLVGLIYTLTSVAIIGGFTAMISTGKTADEAKNMATHNAEQIEELKECYNDVKDQLKVVEGSVTNLRLEQTEKLHDLQTEQKLTNQALELLLNERGMTMPEREE